MRGPCPPFRPPSCRKVAGPGITTLAVLQSLSQARDKWGEQQAGTLWDAAIAKVILGGGSNARDLTDLATLIGDRDEKRTSVSRDHYGRRSTSSSVGVPVMEVSGLRTPPLGTGVLLLRTAPPVVLDPVPWTARLGHRDLAAGIVTPEGGLLKGQRLAMSPHGAWLRLPSVAERRERR